MAKQLIIGLVGEGPTDYRFLTGVIKRVFEQFAYECKGDIEILDIQEIKIEKQPFISFVEAAAKVAHEEYGVSILCVHTDADAKSDKKAFEERITPAFQAIEKSDKELCKNLIPIVPITMTESWMLADKQLFCEEIGTKQSYSDLDINGNVETINDPKEIIKQAINIVYSKYRKRRRKLNIGELYLPIGRKASIEELMKLKSFQRFVHAVEQMLVKLNFLY